MKFPTKAPIKVCDLIENFSIKSQNLVGIFIIMNFLKFVFFQKTVFFYYFD